MMKKKQHRLNYLDILVILMLLTVRKRKSFDILRDYGLKNEYL